MVCFTLDINIGKAVPCLWHFTARYFSSDGGECYLIQLTFYFIGKPFHTWISICGTRTQVIVFVLNVNIALSVSTQVGIYLSHCNIIIPLSCLPESIMPIMNEKVLWPWPVCLTNCLAGCSEIIGYHFVLTSSQKNLHAWWLVCKMSWSSPFRRATSASQDALLLQLRTLCSLSS